MNVEIAVYCNKCDEEDLEEYSNFIKYEMKGGESITVTYSPKKERHSREYICRHCKSNVLIVLERDIDETSSPFNPFIHKS